MSIENLALVRRFFDEACTGRRPELLDELLTPDFVTHIPQSMPAHGRDEAKAAIAIYQDALDGRWEIEEMFAADDRVVTRWVGRGTHVAEISGIPATGAEIAVEALSVHRIADGRIAEDWTVWDALGLLQQIGAVPAAV